MTIEYGRPLSKGWDRMKKALFQPFDLGKWFTLGFTAFLATLADCQGGNGGGNSYSGDNYTDWDELFNFPSVAWEWLINHPLYFNLIIIGLVILFLIGFIFIWLSSRGKFMFLDNVVYDRAEVKKPWFEYRKEGNSLFLWRLAFGLIAMAVFILFFIYCFNTARKIHYEDIYGVTKFWMITKMVLIFLGLIIISGLIKTYLDHFVVPVMYKKRISALKGWSVFLRLFGRHFGHFILYALFTFILGIAVFICVILAALLTCCLGFILLIIPYINAVVLLPVHYLFRAFSIEFLEQFGEEFKLFPVDQTNIQIIE
ncbi:MAG: hypothetical protein JXR31_12300 [Prolixibacteraceae bacterium]|nr:hypothetical protein [Prolixibacteraceae bacterium]MBN2775027.1 hypothetical protein [Prolixibacteraceae bacterium]